MISGTVTNCIIVQMLLENQQGGFLGNCQGSLVFSVSLGASAVELAFTVGTFLPTSPEKVYQVFLDNFSDCKENRSGFINKGWEIVQ